MKTNIIKFIENRWAIILVILLYSIISFYNLGRSYNPKTYIDYKKGSNITYKYDNEYISYIDYFSGRYGSNLIISTSYDGVNYSDIYKSEGRSLYPFSWNRVNLYRNINYIKITFIEESSLGEVSMIDYNHNLIKDNKYSLLSDEGYMHSDYNYMNSTYFDEVYFARSVYEYKNNLNIYEWTHPPLGKMIMSLPVLITNNFSPLTYRLSSIVAGILIVYVTYLLCKSLFNYKYAVLGAILVSLDTFHYTYSRIGTTDSLLTLFIISSIYFMIKYIQTNKWVDLLLSGLLFSFSIATKWSGFYTGIVLVILYFYSLYKNKTNIYRFLICGFSFFIIIPIILYLALYLMYPKNTVVYTSSINKIIDITKQMYSYHSNLTDTHYFSSKFYTWIISYKPVWLYTISYENMRGSISTIGNMIIWIGGIIGFIYSLTRLKKDKVSQLLVITIISLLLPYMFINRAMFLYHYYPALIFVIIALVNLVYMLDKKIKYSSYIVILCSLIFFIIYFPVISGIVVKSDYLERLRLFSSWIF